ncbi:hypothetical protein [uncultured Chloroflexus sp.]|uniref:hypothetical protein n=1 Tax=uncultured Chloroflexus sp. TaxID=214040 RepID=UPI002616C692|nr:hypothetical protein [uncultured Chloroflexus sp.]
MTLLSTRLTILIGPTIPVPAPPSLLAALASAEVTHRDEGRSGFQMVFQLGRERGDLLDYALLAGPLLRVGNRVVLIVWFGALPQVVMDGLITNQQLQPGDQPGSATLTITGEDVSVAMDREEKSVEHPAQSEAVIALKIIASYAQYGLIPLVIPPPTVDMPLPIERTPVQQATDLAYLRQMAERFAYVFYVAPGPAPLTNTAYWGPPVRIGVPQRALTVNMGPATNATSINFQHDPLTATTLAGQVQDRTTGQNIPVRSFASLRPPLASLPALGSFARSTIFRGAGLNAMQALAQAQAATDASSDVLTVEGELDTARYGSLLQARGLVGLRGAGFSYDGLYYVKQVKHQISRDGFKQNFTLTREGLGSTVPVVLP